ncbi:MAG: HAD-IC family P-type ATPase, partial [Myxococcales bacterium]|nr:HAD-IC family P-type ATPase [Myxococcales bacterium]
MPSSSPSTVSFHALSCEEALQRLESQETGLQTSQATERLTRDGLNTIRREQARTPWQLFFSQFKDPLNIMLLIATLIGVLLGEYLDASAMLSIVLLSAILGFIQEFRAERAVEALQKLASPQAKVLRGGSVVQIDASQLVVGDVVQLAAGDMIPADARLLEAADLQVDEASLTGESNSIRKHTRALAVNTHLSDRGNMVFTGTSVVNGSALALVTATGMRTQLGKIAEHILSAEEQKTPLQVKFERIGRQIALAVVALITLVFIATMLNKPAALTFAQHAGSMLLFSVSLAVAAVPSSLPAIVTIGLAMGTAALARKKMLIKRLPAAESLGSITQICSDKTGTLTKNEMTVTRLWTQAQEVEVTGSGYETEGAFLIANESCDLALLELPLRIGLLCNEAQLSEKDGKTVVIGDPTEGSLIVAAQKAFGQKPFADYAQKKIYPFDSTRKRMSAIYAQEGGALEVYAKGAPDLLLACCDRWLTAEGTSALDDAAREAILKQNEQLAKQALRVLALAYKPLEGEIPVSSEDVEQGLIFVGLVGMIDPPRPEVLDAIAKTRSAGIQVMVITGDHASTAQAVAEQIGLFQKGDLVLTGTALEEMDDATLREKLDALRIVSRALPEHKYRIVDLLQKKGHIVAMTG